MNSLIIYNPIAGRKISASTIKKITEKFALRDIICAAIPTSGPGDATRIAINEGGKYDLVICMGGDGTLNETMGGLLNLNDKPSLAYIPAGTTNDYAQSLGIPRNIDEAIKLISKGDIKTVDTGLFNHKNFIYSATFGMMTDVAYKTPQNKKNTFGKLAYIFAAAKHLFKPKANEITVECDDGKIEGNFIFGAITNTKSLGGFIKYKDSEIDLQDGLFEVLLIKKPLRLRTVHKVIFDLSRKKWSDEYCIRFKTNKIKFISKDYIEWCLDGEAGGAYKESIIENIKQNLSIVC